MNAIEVQRCYDADFIDDVMLKLLPYISTDQYPAHVSARSVMTHPEFVFISVRFENVLSGLVMLVRNEVHTMFLPPLRGKNAVLAGREVLKWIWANTPFTKITSYAYSNRPEVKLFARIMGFHPTTVEDDGSTIGGVPVTRTNFSLERPI